MINWWVVLYFLVGTIIALFYYFDVKDKKSTREVLMGLFGNVLLGPVFLFGIFVVGFASLFVDALDNLTRRKK